MRGEQISMERKEDEASAARAVTSGAAALISGRERTFLM